MQAAFLGDRETHLAGFCSIGLAQINSRKSAFLRTALAFGGYLVTALRRGEGELGDTAPASRSQGYAFAQCALRWRSPGVVSHSLEIIDSGRFARQKPVLRL